MLSQCIADGDHVSEKHRLPSPDSPGTMPRHVVVGVWDGWKNAVRLLWNVGRPGNGVQTLLPRGMSCGAEVSEALRRQEHDPAYSTKGEVDM